jgi:hypothetical protein
MVCLLSRFTIHPIMGQALAARPSADRLGLEGGNAQLD